MGSFNENTNNKPFKDYKEYMQYIFDCVNGCLDAYISKMKVTFANGEGGYKNVLYPDIELAGDACKKSLTTSYKEKMRANDNPDDSPKDNDKDVSKGEEKYLDPLFSAFSDESANSDGSEEDDDNIDDELLQLLGQFAADNDVDAEEDSMSGNEEGDSADIWAEIEKDVKIPVAERLQIIDERAKLTVEAGIALPFYELCDRLHFEPFTKFCFACGILSSTQTDYAGVFHIINENGNLSAPTIESAAKVFFGADFSITRAYGDMSACLEQLLPVLPLQVMGSMPFSTVVSPDKRMIDFLFGRNPLLLDENYNRFIYMLTDDKELDPVMANDGRLEAMKTSYEDGIRIFYYYGDDGSGRRFFVKHF